MSNSVLFLAFQKIDEPIVLSEQQAGLLLYPLLIALLYTLLSVLIGARWLFLFFLAERLMHSRWRPEYSSSCA